METHNNNIKASLSKKNSYISSNSNSNSNINSNSNSASVSSNSSCLNTINTYNHTEMKSITPQITNTKNTNPSSYNNKNTNSTTKQQMLSKIKKLAVQSYRTVKKHTKQSNYLFTEPELKNIYIDLSNSLKLIEKLETKNKQNNTKLQHSNPLFNQAYFSTRITQLQQQLQTIRSQSLRSVFLKQQQIKQLIHSYQQQIGLIQREHNQYVIELNNRNNQMMSQLKSQYQSTIKTIVSECELRMAQSNKAMKQRQQQIQRIVQQRWRAILGEKQRQFQKVVGQLLKRIEMMKVFVSAASADDHNNYNRTDCNNINNKNNNLITIDKMELLRLVTERIAQKNKMNNNRRQSFLNQLKAKLTALIINKGQQQSKQQSLPVPMVKNSKLRPNNKFGTMNNDYENNRNIIDYENSGYSQQQQQQQQLQNSCIEGVIQRVIEQLVRWGFFCKENQQCVISLFKLAEQQGNSRQCRQHIGLQQRQQEGEEQGQQMGILRHSLYPVIMERIKLTMAMRWGQQQYLTNTGLQYEQKASAIVNGAINKNSVSQPSHHPSWTNNKQSNIKTISNQNHNNIYYRNIQSLSQLEVSDSMISYGNQAECGEQGLRGLEGDHGDKVEVKINREKISSKGISGIMIDTAYNQQQKYKQEFNKVSHFNDEQWRPQSLFQADQHQHQRQCQHQHPQHWYQQQQGFNKDIIGQGYCGYENMNIKQQMYKGYESNGDDDNDSASFDIDLY